MPGLFIRFIAYLTNIIKNYTLLCETPIFFILVITKYRKLYFAIFALLLKIESTFVHSTLIYPSFSHVKKNIYIYIPHFRLGHGSWTHRCEFARTPSFIRRSDFVNKIMILLIFFIPLIFFKKIENILKINLVFFLVEHCNN